MTADLAELRQRQCRMAYVLAEFAQDTLWRLLVWAIRVLSVADETEA